MITEKGIDSSPKALAYVALAASIVFGVSGQLLMKWAAVGTADGIASVGVLLKFAIALLIYSLGVFNWIVALRGVKLSVAYPITSVNYVGILIGSYYIFGEHLTVVRLTGVALIFAGVLLVALNSAPSDDLSEEGLSIGTEEVAE
jgi:multidrug transporter EmrE-like cation transporter